VCADTGQRQSLTLGPYTTLFRSEALAAKYPGDQLTDEDGSTWFVGDLALAQLPPGELLRLRGRTANEKTMGNTFRLRLAKAAIRSEEHTSELQSRANLVCRLLPD